MDEFVCPFCRYEGVFIEFNGIAGKRLHAVCPRCGSFERHRLQFMALSRIRPNTGSVLQIAPDSIISRIFGKAFRKHVTAVLERRDVDYRINISNIPFPDNSFDLVFASHVLEHVKHDMKALHEVYRVLKPQGIAVLPVPIVAKKTIEYDEQAEYGHVRAPGPDYYDKYKNVFSRVETYSSNDFPEKYQLYLYEDRSVWPTKECPRPPMPGNKHVDIVPICYK